MIEMTSYQIDMLNNILCLQEQYWFKMNEIVELQLKKEKMQQEQRD